MELQIQKILKNGRWEESSGKLLAYVHEATQSKIVYGNDIQFKTQLQLPETPKNPGAFDYSAYLKRKQIFHTCFIEDKNYSITGNPGMNFILDFAIKIKTRLLHQLHTNGLEGQELAIASSLLLGYDEDVSNELTVAYAATGTIHVLSVSGLHIGIVYLMLTYLLSFVGNTPRGRMIKGILIVLSVWMFALISGLSPAAVRASVMFTLLITGSTFRLQTNPINTLLASAFLMLIWNPLLITDVGFQLSYLALGGILLFQPSVYSWFQFKNNIVEKIWALSSVSIAAQLTTFPITLYYFHQFTISFLVANLLIIPLSTLIMYGAILLLLVSPFELLTYYCVYALKLLIRLMNNSAYLMSKIPGTVFNHWHVSFSEMILIYSILISLILFFSLKSSKYLWLSLAFLFIFLCETVINYTADNSRKELVVYHIKKESCAAIFYGHQIVRFGKPNNDVLNYEVESESRVFENKEINSDGIISVNDFSIAVIEQPKFFAEKKIVDAVLLRKNPRVSLEALGNYFPGATLIADGSNSFSRSMRWKKTADSLHLKFWNTYEQGAFQLKK